MSKQKSVRMEYGDHMWMPLPAWDYVQKRVYVLLSVELESRHTWRLLLAEIRSIPG